VFPLPLDLLAPFLTRAQPDGAAAERGGADTA
jgi:hypothetical protein